MKTTNLFAFDAQILFSGTQTPLLSFYPIGNGRPELIRLIHEYELFKQPETERTAINKLCLDYSKQDNNNDVGPMACSIAAHYVDQILDECLTSDYYHFIEYAGPSLTVIYRMPNFCRVWLTSFLDKMSEYHKCANDAKERIARDTIQWTMKNAYPQMVSTFTKELCALFETYWTHDTSAKMPFYSGHLSDDSLTKSWLRDWAKKIPYLDREMSGYENHKFWKPSQMKGQIKQKEKNDFDTRG